MAKKADTETQKKPSYSPTVVASVIEKHYGPLAGYVLYKLLKDAGFPQGGSGSYIQHPETDERVYVPQPSEIYAHVVGDPADWQILTDAMARAWLEIRGK